MCHNGSEMTSLFLLTATAHGECLLQNWVCSSYKLWRIATPFEDSGRATQSRLGETRPQWILKLRRGMADVLYLLGFENFIQVRLDELGQNLVQCAHVGELRLDAAHLNLASARRQQRPFPLTHAPEGKAE